VTGDSGQVWPPTGFFAGWRGLGRFWALLFAGVALCCLWAEIVGPLGHTARVEAAHTTSRKVVAERAAPSSRPVVSVSAGADQGLLEPDPDQPGELLPRIGLDGRAPMTVYAAAVATSQPHKVGIVIANIGLGEADSMAAIRLLPAAVTLAVSPYADAVTPILSAIRQTHREYLLSVPMEPAGYPVNDPDSRYALMTSLPPAENLVRLHWVLSRMTGYVGVTSILGAMQGEAMMTNPDQIKPVLHEIAGRGLLFIGGTSPPRQLPYVWSREADIVLDKEPFDAAVVDRRLADLVATAQDKGSALGVVTQPRPLIIGRIAAWANTLGAAGVALVPVSGLVAAPARQEARQ
jgi:polysaccharide deacetylase 2 family uncharacterized protein YibQ